MNLVQTAILLGSKQRRTGFYAAAGKKCPAAARLLKLTLASAIALTSCGAALGENNEPEGQLTDEQCKELVKNQLGTSVERYTESFNAYMQMSIIDIQRQCELNDAQVRRLEIASKGAIDRFLDRWLDACTNWTIQRISQSRRKLDKATVVQFVNPGTLDHYESNFGVHLVRTAISNEKIWTQTLQDSLSAAQRELYEEVTRTRTAQLKSTSCQYLLAKLDEDLLLSQPQREQLSGHIATVIGDTPSFEPIGQYGHMLLMGKLGKIPLDVIQGILDDRQLAIWKRHSKTFAQFANINPDQLFGPWAELIKPSQEKQPEATDNKTK